MRRRLYFYLYEQSDIETNIAFKVHEIMLKKYIHVFDELNFIVAVNDTEKDGEKALEWIRGVCESAKVSFAVKIVDNIKIRESRVVKEDILPMIENECEDEIFFAHSKGITDVNMAVRDKESVLRWVISMYYYSLEHIDDVDKKLENRGFYGSLLTHFYYGKMNDTNEKTHRTFYIGNFYWLKPSQLKGKLIENVYKSMENSRFLAENFPLCYPIEELSSYNDAVTDSREADLYYLKTYRWPEYLSRYGDVEEVFSLQNLVLTNAIFPDGVTIVKD